MINAVKDFIFQALSRQTIQVVTSLTLAGKVVIITGATRGIGKATADVLLKQGASVVIVSRGSEVVAAQDRLLVLTGDITQEDDCHKIVQQTIKKFGKVDVIINNAGMFSGRALEQTTLAEWQKSFAVNLEGMFLMSKAVLPVMKKQKNGLIINIGSKISRKTNVTPHKVLYAATKYAVEGFSYALNNEVKSSGIRAVCLMPDTVNTHRSLKAAEFLSPVRIGQIISTVIQMEEVSFDNLVLTSKYQTL